MELKPKKNYKIYLENCERQTIKELIFSAEDLLHAIITCGMPEYYLTPQNLSRRKYELFYKINLIQCALDELPDPDDPDKALLVLSENLRYLDPSEKSVLSYYIGMFFTKLISEKIFHVPYLIHLSIAQMKHTIQFDGKERPDLIGYNLINDDYSVFEAKGRINFIQATLDKACAQTRSVRYISRHKPSLRIANMTYFRKNILRSAIQKPKGIGEVSMDFPPDKLLQQYYRPVCELIDAASGPNIAGHTFQDTINYAEDYCRFGHISMPGQRSITLSLPSAIYNIFFDRSEYVDMQIMMEYAMAHKDEGDFIQIEFAP